MLHSDHPRGTNVAGFLGTTRIALNDNLLQQCSFEIRAVMGHEMGHYVLNHGAKLLTYFAISPFSVRTCSRPLRLGHAELGRKVGRAGHCRSGWLRCSFDLQHVGFHRHTVH